MRCYIGLGSNLAHQHISSVEILQQAVQALAKIGTISVSKLYKSPPMGPQDQPDYFNAVVALDTDLEPLPLLDYLQACEQQAGRVRLRRWGERTLDLDLLLYGQQNIQNERLTVPHIGVLERDFVLLPLLDLDPEIVVAGQKVADLTVVKQSTLQQYADTTWVNESL